MEIPESMISDIAMIREENQIHAIEIRDLHNATVPRLKELCHTMEAVKVGVQWVIALLGLCVVFLGVLTVRTMLT